MESSGRNWSEAVEDLVHKGDIEKAIIILESVVSKLGKEATDVSSSPELAPTLLDLSRLYSMKADEVHRVLSKGSEFLPLLFLIDSLFFSHSFPHTTDEIWEMGEIGITCMFLVEIEWFFFFLAYLFIVSFIYDFTEI